MVKSPFQDRFINKCAAKKKLKSCRSVVPEFFVRYRRTYVLNNKEVKYELFTLKLCAEMNWLCGESRGVWEGWTKSGAIPCSCWHTWSADNSLGLGWLGGPCFWNSCWSWRSSFWNSWSSWSFCFWNRCCSSTFCFWNSCGLLSSCSW